MYSPFSGNLPFYAPCSEELKLEIEKQGSCFIHLGRPGSFPVDWNSNTAAKDNHTTPQLGCFLYGQRPASSQNHKMTESLL
ncbi:LOW QUALITY PROTEIN: hypothetical protein TorRG33x02_106820 [Trema orientale]|uniref:Uncharacterized protein n=1 Tax=Trema orientale TaxID=63057 RepID=A0A2P5F6I3_TREOI|nr:LOW QUALITY PROTEIN: hypothetical protein TorRG33x02_106820 [Trema orientale]